MVPPLTPSVPKYECTRTQNPIQISRHCDVMGIPQRYACHYQFYTWLIVKNNLFDDDQQGISLYLDTVHSVLPARTARGQLFRRYFADIVTELFKYSVRTTTKTSTFLDKHSINKPVQ
jgi:hypothetical protein